MGLARHSLMAQRDSHLKALLQTGTVNPHLISHNLEGSLGASIRDRFTDMIHSFRSADEPGLLKRYPSTAASPNRFPLPRGLRAAIRAAREGGARRVSRGNVSGKCSPTLFA